MVKKSAMTLPYWVKVLSSIIAATAQMVLSRKLIGSDFPNGNLLALGTWVVLCIFAALFWTTRRSHLLWTVLGSVVMLCIWWIGFGDFTPAISIIDLPVLHLAFALLPVVFAFSAGMLLGCNGIIVSGVTLGLVALGFIEVEMVSVQVSVVGGWREYLNLRVWQIGVIVAVGISIGLTASSVGSGLKSALRR